MEARLPRRQAVHAAPGLRKKRRDIAFDADLGNTPSAEWTGEIDQVLMQGNLITTEAVFFHARSGTVPLRTCSSSFPPPRSPVGVPSWRSSTSWSAPSAAVPRKFRVAFIGRRAARHSLERIFAWPAETVLMAHGTPVEKNARAFLRRAFGWLAR